MLRMGSFALVVAVGAGISPLSSAGANAQHAPSSAALIDALLASDPDAIPRLGRAAGSSGLSGAISTGPRRARLAAILAAPDADDAWALLEPLSRAAADHDRTIATAAGNAAHSIAQTLSYEDRLTFDIPDDALREALESWRSISGAAHRWTDLRIHAMDIGRDLTRAIAGDALAEDVAFDHNARLVDPDPEIRIAALQLLSPSASTAARIAERVRDDSDPAVALVAAQIFCEGIATEEAPRTRVDADGMNRLRALLGDSTLIAASETATLLGAARCLIIDTLGEETKNRATLRALLRRGPQPLRRELKRLVRARR